MGRSWGVEMVCRLPGAPRRLPQLSTDLAPLGLVSPGELCSRAPEGGSAVSPRGGGGPRTCSGPRADPRPRLFRRQPPPLSSALLLFATCLGWRTVFYVHRLGFLFETLKKNPFIFKWWPRLTVLQWDTYPGIHF